MKIVRLAALMLLTAAPLQAAEPATGAWTLGANFGVSVLSFSAGGDNFTGFNVPSGSGLFNASIQPGMKVGYEMASGTSDIFLDLGINYANYGGGDSFYSYILTGNYQFNFSPAEVTSLYGTLGGGFHVIGGSGSSESDPLVGLGVGLRKKVADGHGAVRGEVRYDRMINGDDSINSFALKLGVDLRIR
jgi:hypothetical protein